MRGSTLTWTKSIQIKLTQQGSVQQEQPGATHQDTTNEEEEEEEEQSLLRRKKPCTEARESAGSGPVMNKTPIDQNAVVEPTLVGSTLGTSPEVVKTVPPEPEPETTQPGQAEQRRMR
mgnify:CR=1 FL=1